MAPLFIAGRRQPPRPGSKGACPISLLIAAQVVIGSALGAQFRPEFLTRLFRLLLGVVRGACCSRPGRWPCSARRSRGWPAIQVPTMVLAMAPAGIAEMVLTGKVLGLDSTMIAGFQLMRILIVLIWCRTALVVVPAGSPSGPSARRRIPDRA